MTWHHWCCLASSCIVCDVVLGIRHVVVSSHLMSCSPYVVLSCFMLSHLMRTARRMKRDDMICRGWGLFCMRCDYIEGPNLTTQDKTTRDTTGRLHDSPPPARVTWYMVHGRDKANTTPPRENTTRGALFATCACVHHKQYETRGT